MDKRTLFSLNRKGASKQVSTADNINSTIDPQCQKVCQDIADSFVTLANEPSLACFRIQEHVRKCAPALLDERARILQLQCDLQGRCFDLDYAISALKATSRATPHLSRLNELLKSSLFTKLQLDYANRHRSDFELGVDVANTLVSDTPRPPSPSATAAARGPSYSSFACRTDESVTVQQPAPSEPDMSAAVSSTVNHPPTHKNSAYSPPFRKLANSMSIAATEVRHRAVNLSRRALLTRSAEVTSTSTTLTSPGPSTTEAVTGLDLSERPLSNVDGRSETGVEVEEGSEQL
ncbi:hypothetical protein EG68_03421 [Paragonimus skrjabini miyazakii]|uniref:Uncharacterized protein n=1 Tax=Paragonimus skrjabini miyazakii TaxID=59628 RepID=A0A8S9YYD7_9TREM|nr:hypothetical protein EG68_03421 [Paragonimus skrjabini miyazakii]